MKVRTGLGQDSHRFESSPSGRPLLLGGVLFEGEAALEGNSDADVLLHALANAISGITGCNVMGTMSDEMCQASIRDSRAYVRAALQGLDSLRLTHVSVSLECLRPFIASKLNALRESVAALLNLSIRDVGITAHSGERLSAFGRGEGIQATVLVTAVEP